MLSFQGIILVSLTAISISACVGINSHRDSRPSGNASSQKLPAGSMTFGRASLSCEPILNKGVTDRLIYINATS
ncbi:MAG: hypothetical protein NTX25_08970 [Proteobacteria bacterium]|nr:hypothetical protein [Pseudomonadota bacterium]